VFRCLYALPFLFLLARQEDLREGACPPRERWLAAGAGVFFAFDLLAYHHAVEQVGAGLGTVLPNLQVVFVAIAAWIIWRERPSGQVLLALPLAIAGAILISGVFERAPYGQNPPLGVAFGLIAAISYGAFLLVIRQGNRSGERSFGTLLDASAMTVLVGLIAGFIVGDLDLRPTLPAHGWLLLLAITSQVAGYGFINISLPRLPAVLTSVLLLAQPVATVILSAILLGESPSPGQLLGVAALISGLAVASVPLGRVRDRLRTATE
jgi:drug/metabolite transporter (DMT)-like permease